MATALPFLAQLSRPYVLSCRPASLSTSIRCLSTTAPCAAKKVVVKRAKGENPMKNKKKGESTTKKKKKKNVVKEHNMKDAELFSLIDAMRYIRAFEVGQDPQSAKYDMSIRLKTLKNGPVVRNRLRLPHPVKTNTKICVICPPNSKYAEQAKAAGAWLVGEEEVFEMIKDGKIDFDRCICQTSSFEKLAKAGLGRILGPKGLMPSTRNGTVVADPTTTIRDMVGGAEYRERQAVVNMAIGQLAFTPEELARNIKVFMDAMKKDIALLSDRINKEIVEVVLSSTRAPGFPLSGEFQNPNSPVTSRDLSTSS